MITLYSIYALMYICPHFHIDISNCKVFVLCFDQNSINHSRPEDGMLEKASVILIEHISLRSVEVSLHYDVFISYSHRNLAAAKVFLETFQKLSPELKVFFDYDALKTGNAPHWVFYLLLI